MASKFRNLIASKVHPQVMASGSVNQGSNPPSSLQDLEAKMRLVATGQSQSETAISNKPPTSLGNRTVYVENRLLNNQRCQADKNMHGMKNYPVVDQNHLDPHRRLIFQESNWGVGRVGNCPPSFWKNRRRCRPVAARRIMPHY